MYRDLRDRNEVFAGLLGVYPFAASVAAGGTTERAAGELVTGNYFGVLGVPPELGRVFSPDDDRAPGAHPLAVLSHGYWARRFGERPVDPQQDDRRQRPVPHGRRRRARGVRGRPARPPRGPLRPDRR